MPNQNPQNPQQPQPPGAEQGIAPSTDQGIQQPQQPFGRRAQAEQGPGARPLISPGLPGNPAQGILPGQTPTFPGQTPTPGQKPMRVASPGLDPTNPYGNHGNYDGRGAAQQTPGGRQGQRFSPPPPLSSGPLQHEGAAQVGSPGYDTYGLQTPPAQQQGNRRDHTPQPHTTPPQAGAQLPPPQRIASQQRSAPQPDAFSQPPQVNATPPSNMPDMPPNIQARYWQQGDQATQQSEVARPGAAPTGGGATIGAAQTRTPAPDALPVRQPDEPFRLARLFWPAHITRAQRTRWEKDGYGFGIPVTDPTNRVNILSVRLGLGLSGLAAVVAFSLLTVSIITATAFSLANLLDTHAYGAIVGVVGLLLAFGGIVVNGRTMLAMQRHTIRRAEAQRRKIAQEQAAQEEQAAKVGGQQPSAAPPPDAIRYQPKEEIPEPWVFEQRAPAQFEDREPDAALGDRYPATATLALERDGWAIVGASLRGLSHKHDAKFREDAIAGAIVSGWQIGVVCDGGGSYELARVGANVAAAAAIKGASATANKYRKVSQRDAETALRAILLAALQGAHDALHEEEEARGVSWQDMRTTLLVVVQRYLGKDDKKSLGIHALGGAQVGDGAIVARFYNPDAINDQMLRITSPDIGPTGNETIFFQDVPPEQWEQRMSTFIKEGPGCYCLAMTDGISDDFTPIEHHMPLLEEPLFRDVLKGQSPGKVTGPLEQLLSYERPGSFDDRSLVCIYHLGEQPWK